MKSEISLKTTKILILTIISVSLPLTINQVASVYISLVAAQNISSTEEEGQGGGKQTLHITKDATNSYTIFSGASFIGSFDTTYSIVGGVSSINTSKELVIYTIIEDFGSSPTIGYINTTTSSISSGFQTNPNQPTLLNPFANEEAINEKIRKEISAAIDSAAQSNFANGEIKCTFGTSLDEFKCDFHGLVG
jgi:hypothetical protein